VLNFWLDSPFFSKKLFILTVSTDSSTQSTTKRQPYIHIYIYIKRLGMFPFKVQLFQGCKSETEPINTKSVVHIRYRVLLAACYKADTNYCCCRATCLSGHIVDFSTHTSIHQPLPSIVGGILQGVLNLIQCAKVSRGVKVAEPCERYRRNRRRNANESLVEKSNRLRDRNETPRR
jgi:hypothetical protein